jgi:hypothetical protein
MAEHVAPAAAEGQRPSVGTATIRKQQPPKQT